MPSVSCRILLHFNFDCSPTLRDWNILISRLKGMHTLPRRLLMPFDDCITYCLHWYNLLVGQLNFLHTLPRRVRLSHKINSSCGLQLRTVLFGRRWDMYQLLSRKEMSPD